MFTCKTCPAGSNTHTNDFTNRLSCYPCDYDMCRQCVANRWGPEALVFTEDDGRLGFGRSAVFERHRSVDEMRDSRNLGSTISKSGDVSVDVIL